MIIPCNLALKKCLPCNDDPIRNITAEAPDVNVFIGFRDFKWNPPLGVTYFQLGCKTICFSEVSQQEANLCALRGAEECVWDGGDTPVVPPVPPGPNSPGGKGGGPNLPPSNPRGPIPRYRNTVQTCDSLCSDGSVHTETVAAGTITELSQALADAKAESLACRRAQQNRFCITGGIPPSACVGGDYLFQLGASGGSGLVWSIDGSLPPGLEFDLFTGTISGTPSVGGSYQFVVDVSDSEGHFQSTVLTICIMEITTDAELPDATPGEEYSTPLVQQPGTVSSEVWTLVSGSLPTGIELASNGALNGTPTDIGTSEFTLRVDATCNGSAVSCEKAFSLEVSSGCGVDWGTITWDTFSIVLNGTAGGSGSAAGDTIQFDIQDDPTVSNAGEAIVHANGSVIADVHECSFKLRIYLLEQDLGGPGQAGLFFGIAIYQDGMNIFSKHHGNSFSFPPTLALGLNEFDVSLIEATESLIEIKADVFSPGPLGDIMAIIGGVVGGPHVECEMEITLSDT